MNLLVTLKRKRDIVALAKAIQILMILQGRLLTRKAYRKNRERKLDLFSSHIYVTLDLETICNLLGCV